MFQSEDTTNLFPGEVFLRAQQIWCNEGLPRLYWRHKAKETQEYHSKLPLSGLSGILWGTFGGRQGFRSRDSHPYVPLSFGVFRCRHFQVYLFLPFRLVPTSCCIINYHCVCCFVDHTVMQNKSFAVKSPCEALFGVKNCRGSPCTEGTKCKNPTVWVETSITVWFPLHSSALLCQTRLKWW